MSDPSWLLTQKPSFLSEWLGLPPKESHQVLEKINHLLQDPTPDAKVKKQLKGTSKNRKNLG
jgi:mRNA-degrading endonuclease RelE of RelBE toxin-antitoxin system